MTCPSELQLSMYVDGELVEAAAVEVAAHVADCSACSARVSALRSEVDVLAAALTRTARADDDVDVPAFRGASNRRAGAGLFALVLVGAAIGWWLPGRLLQVPEAVSWFNPLDAGGLLDIGVRAMIFLVDNGGAVMTAIAEMAALAVLAGLIWWLAAAARSKRSGPMMMAGVLLCLVAGWPAPSQALEIRRADDGDVLVASGETIDDTLIAAGRTVEIDGDVNGDLIAAGRRVVIRGRVSGQVLTAAQTVTVEGEVGGTLVGFAEELRVRAQRIGNNLFGFGSTVTVDEGAHVEGNAAVFGQRASVSGPVGRDLMGFAEEVEVANSVGGDVTTFSSRVRVLAPARISGDLSMHVPDEDNVTISPEAVVEGRTNTDVEEWATEQKSDYATGGFYVGQLLRFGAGFVAGLVLFTVVPRLRRVSLDSVSNALVAGAVGAIALVATPVLAVLVAITIIGLPVGVVGFVLWLLGLYLAKIVLALVIGDRLLDSRGGERHFAGPLALGLAIVLVAVNVPWVGGVVEFLLTICGLGVLVLFVWRYFQGENPAGQAA